MASSKFQLNYELTDYGKLRFEYDDNLNELEMSRQKKQAMLKSPGFYVMAVFLFLMVTWFLASFITNTIKSGILSTLATHFGGAFMLFVVAVILILSITGNWSKFIRLASKSKSTSLKEFNSQEQEAEGIREVRKNALQIYDDYLVVTNSGNVRVFDLHQVDKVRMDIYDNKNKKYAISFTSIGGVTVYADVKIPNERLILAKLKKIFDDKLVVNRPIKAAIRQCDKPIGTLIGMTFFVLIFILAGVGVIFMHYYVEQSIPVFLGVFFIVGGIAGLCGVYDFIPILKDVLLPLLAGSIFIFFPISLIQLVFNSMEKELTLKAFFSQFNVYSVAVVFFGFIAILCIITAIKNLIDYIRYRKV